MPDGDGFVREGLDALSEGFGIFDAEWRLVTCNRLFHELRGYPESLCQAGTRLGDMLRYSADRGDFGPGDPDEHVAERLAAIRREQGRQQIRENYRGQILRIQYSHLSGGGICVSYEDITAERQAQDELIRSDARYDLVTRATSEGFYDWNIETNLLKVSDQLNAIFNFETGELTSETWANRVHPDDMPAYMDALTRHFKRQTPRMEVDYRIRDKSDEYRWVRDHGLAQYRDSGRARRLVGAIRDVTRVKAQEAELQRQTRLLEVTMENIDQGISMVDEDLNVVAFNHRFLELMQFPEDEFKPGFHMEQAFRYNAERGEYGPGDIETQIQERLELSRRFQPHRFERVRGDGVVLEIIGRPVAGGGFVTTYSDITDRVQSQERLIQSEKMASLGQLTAGIAHEIKNPLNFVNNFAKLSGRLLDDLEDLHGDLAPHMNEAHREDADDILATLRTNLEKIGEHGARADGIVKNMLAHSREGPSERRAFDINAALEESLNLAYHGARAENAEFNIAFETDLDTEAGEIVGYQQDLSRVFINLFNNSFYATQKRKLENPEFTPILSVSSRANGRQVNLTVRDNGAGIPPEVMDQVFNPFFTTKPTGEGTGLGLSLSYDIVAKQHGGEMTVSSEPGAFTEFQITLPRESEGDAA